MSIGDSFSLIGLLVTIIVGVPAIYLSLFILVKDRQQIIISKFNRFKEMSSIFQCNLLGIRKRTRIPDVDGYAEYKKSWDDLYWTLNSWGLNRSIAIADCMRQFMDFSIIPRIQKMKELSKEPVPSSIEIVEDLRKKKYNFLDISDNDFRKSLSAISLLHHFFHGFVNESRLDTIFYLPSATDEEWARIMTQHIYSMGLTKQELNEINAQIEKDFKEDLKLHLELTMWNMPHDHFTTYILDKYRVWINPEFEEPDITKMNVSELAFCLWDRYGRPAGRDKYFWDRAEKIKRNK